MFMKIQAGSEVSGVSICSVIPMVKTPLADLAEASFCQDAVFCPLVWVICRCQRGRFVFYPHQ